MSSRPGDPHLRFERGPVTAQRLTIRPRKDTAWVDLVPRDPPDAAPVAALRVPRDAVLLDALHYGDDTVGDIYASEFNPTTQQGRVRRWRTVDGGARAADDLLVGAPGEVLWWLHVRDGALSVREVRRGTSYRIDGLRVPDERWGEPAPPVDARPGP